MSMLIRHNKYRPWQFKCGGQLNVVSNGVHYMNATTRKQWCIHKEGKGVENKFKFHIFTIHGINNAIYDEN